MRRQTGFSLIEMVVAITLLAILAGASAIFLRGPIAGYFDLERRSDLAESGQLAMAALEREISRAVPNSVRVVSPVGGGFFVEFLPVRDEARYRSTAPGNALNDGSNRFDVLPAGDTVNVQAGDWVVVNSHVSNVWAGAIRAAYTGAAGAVATVNHAAMVFATDPQPNPQHRFQIAGGPVTYACNSVTGGLRRYSAYALQAAQPANALAVPLSLAQNDLLAERVIACRAVLTPGTRRRATQLAVQLTLRDTGDTLNLYHAIRGEVLP